MTAIEDSAAHTRPDFATPLQQRLAEPAPAAAMPISMEMLDTPASPFVDEDFIDEPQVSLGTGASRAAFQAALSAEAPLLEEPTRNRAAVEARRARNTEPAPAPAGRGGAARGGPERADLWTDRRLVEDMRGELSRMRRLIEEELPGLAWASLGTHRPQVARLVRRCAAAGISPSLSRQLVNDLPPTQEGEAWLECLARLGGRLQLLGDRLARGGGWHVLLGPTGAGKTTLAVKLAAREVMSGRGDRLHIVGLDHRRVGAAEQLRAYARVLGLTVHEPSGVEQLLALAQTFGADDRVIVDTAGLLPGMPMPAWLAALEEEGHTCLRHWVFSATSDRRVLERAAAAARQSGVQACCLTRLDECASLGPSLSAIAEHGLALGYLGTGPNIPDDLAVARADVLLAELAASTEQSVRDDLELEVEHYARAWR
jgi:flagellar biosynthesis protein FlhF